MKNKKTTPFTYLIGWKSLDKWYYGVKYSYGCKPDDLWNTYFTSSKEIKKYRSEFGEPDVIEIRKIFKDSNSARKWEDKVHRKMDVVKSPRWLNKCYGNEKFKTDGLVCAKDLEGNIYHVNSEDARPLSGELKHWSYGKVVVKDSNGDKHWVDKNDKRIGIEFESLIEGTTLAYDSHTLEFVGRYLTTDPIWNTGSVVASPHFKNSVATNIGMVSKDDERLKRGEIHHVNSKTSPAMLKDGTSIGRVSTSDPRWDTGEILSLSKNTVMAKNSITGEFVGRISKNDPRWKTGEICSIMKGTIMAKCAKTGVSVGRVSKEDPRWALGEIVGIKAKLSS